MNKIPETKVVTKNALNDKTKKGAALKVRQIQATCDMLHRYFALRVAQSRVYGG